MIFACMDRDRLEMLEIKPDDYALLKEAVWIDLLTPTKEEEHLIEGYLQFEIPTREDMVEIELSSRLYKDNATLFMTATMIAQSDSPDPKIDPVTFIYDGKQLITIRYIEPLSFKLVIAHLKRLARHDAESIFIELMDATVDRLADILELVGRRLDEYSKTLFRPQSETNERLDYQQLILTIGANGELNTKARESLVTFNRLVTFLGQSGNTTIDDDGHQRLITLGKDISSLSDHVNFLSSRVNFLLDATLGMVNIEQNNIIKIFSVAAVIFLPPTLVASVYGMNFQFIPELQWRYGYLFAISMIIFAAWVPYRYFKYKKWL